jgi:hypothetical protein
MAEPARKPMSARYEDELAAWAHDQADVLRRRIVAQLDWDNLAEQIESVGGRERRELRSRLRVLIIRLLKWECQPEKRGHGWQSAIGEQRIHIAGVIEDSPSLKGHLGDILQDCYKWARSRAALEANPPLATFPENAPYSVEQVLDYGFMLGRPWLPGELK